MNRSSLTLTALLLGGLSAMAQGVDPKIHAMCLDAKDYVGCVKAMTTDASQQKVIQVDQTNRPGLQNEMGNSCPAGYAYSGAGQCRSIVCQYQGIFGQNEPQLAGNGHTCKGANRRYGLLTGRATLLWGNQYMRAVNNPNCPNTEPSIGGRSSCSLTSLNDRLPKTDSMNIEDWDSDE